MKEIKNSRKSDVFREKDDYIDHLVDRAVDKAIEDRKRHLIFVRKRKVMLLAAATVLLFFSLGAGYFFRQTHDLPQPHPASSPSPNVIAQASTPSPSTDRGVDAKGKPKAANMRHRPERRPDKVHRSVPWGSRHSARPRSEDAFDEVLNSIDDQDMKYIDDYEVEDIPEY
jgi:hypothetical protein